MGVGISRFWGFMSAVTLCICLQSCNEGLYVPSTANVPMVDTVKKSEVMAIVSLWKPELQQNHVIAKKWVLQNNIAVRMLDPLKNFKTELGLGPLGKHPFVLGLGVSNTDMVVCYGCWTDGNQIELGSPFMLNAFAQKTTLFGYDKYHGMHLTYKGVLMYSPETRTSYSTYEKDLFFIINELNLMWYFRTPLRFQFSIGGKIGLPGTDVLGVHNLHNERFYARLGFRI